MVTCPDCGETVASFEEHIIPNTGDVNQDYAEIDAAVCPSCDDRKCPDAIRHGSVTHYLSQDVPVAIIGDRMDVSRDVLDNDDKRSEEVYVEQRRAYLRTV